jgi:uncharacterized damage-inducible protein DinB
MMLRTDDFLDAYDRMIRATEAIFDLVPEDKIEWAPQAGMMTCGQQMLHIAGSLKAYVDGVKNGSWPHRTMEEILKKNDETPSATTALAKRLLTRSANEYRKMLSEFTDADFSKEVFSPQFKKEVPRWKLVLLSFEHHHSHKAELFTYLRVLGVDVGTKELYFGQDY